MLLGLAVLSCSHPMVQPSNAGDTGSTPSPLALSACASDSLESCALDFGKIPLGSSTGLDIIISNPTETAVDFSVPASPLGPFAWDEIPPQSMRPSRTGGVKILRVRFTPTDLDDAIGELIVVVGGADGISVKLRGAGATPPIPCIPTSNTVGVDFGVVALFSSPSRAIEVRNEGEENNGCIFSDAHLEMGSDPDFQISDVAKGPPTVLVGITPTRYGDFAGVLTIRESTTNTEFRIPLHARVQDPCSGGDCGFQKEGGGIYLTSGGGLAKMNFPNAAPTLIGSFRFEPPFTGPAAVQINDLAIAPDGSLFGNSRAFLFRIDAGDARCHYVRALPTGDAWGITFSASGEVVVAQTSRVLSVNLDSGKTNTLFDGNGFYVTSGDVVADSDGSVLWTVEGGDALLRIGPSAGQANVVGRIGVSGVDGLAWSGNSLVGATRDGQILEINPATSAVVRSSPAVGVWTGAASRSK